MEKTSKDQEFQWVLRVHETYYNGEEDQKYEEDTFATEEDALDRLKEMYETALKEYKIYDSAFEGHKATYRTKYYNKIESHVCMYIKKEKKNYIDMTMEEFYDKISFIYGDEEELTSSAESYETMGRLMDLTNEKWIYNSPYNTFKLQVYYYGSHPDDCCYKIIGKGFGDNNRGREYSRDSKMSEVIQDIKNEDNEYYNMFLSNVKKITDVGGEYYIDYNRQQCEYSMLLEIDDFYFKYIGKNTFSITAKTVDG